MKNSSETNPVTALPEIDLNSEEYSKKRVLRKVFENLAANRIIQRRTVYYEKCYLIPLKENDDKIVYLGIDEHYTHLDLYRHLPELKTLMTSGDVVSGDFEVKIFAQIFPDEIHFPKEEFQFSQDKNFLLETFRWLPIILNNIQETSMKEL
jgi:hypothetical protein